MFITIRRERSHHGHAKPIMNPSNGLLVSLIAAILLLAGLAGTGTTVFSTNANETPRWRSDIMDSYESVPSLAALAKQGNTHARLAPDVAERRAVWPSGVSR